MLAGNHLTALPLELGNCTRLELLRISANHLTEFPRQLLALPRLAWLAFAGNPFCEVQGIGPADNPIAWQRLTLQHTLGEGASGVIHQADLDLLTGKTPQPVAVKLFKGDVTSDGLPQNEMAACLRAGGHPHLIPVMGTVPDHPASASVRHHARGPVRAQYFGEPQRPQFAGRLWRGFVFFTGRRVTRPGSASH